MFALVYVLGLLISGLQPQLSGISIHVIDEAGDVPSAHVCVNNSVVGITDTTGRVSIPNITKGDLISVSHVLYEADEFIVDSSIDTTIVLLPKTFSIPEANYTKDFDYDLLKKKLRPGLDCGTLKERIPVVSTDTLTSGDRSVFIKQWGDLLFYAKYMEPMMTKHNAQITDRDNSSKKALTKEDIINLKTELITCLGNAEYYAETACKCKKYKGFRVEYRGFDENQEIFYFFVPPQDRNDTQKFRGFIYINAQTGVLERIEATGTSMTQKYASYDLRVDYHYLELSNSILPIDIRQKLYLLDKGGSIIQTHRRHIVLDWENLKH